LHGQNLERLLHISSTNDIESDDEDIEQIEDTALRSDDSDAGLEEANAGFQLSPKDKKAYEEFRSAEIFVCPCPTSEDAFGVNYCVYKFYTHMEHPKH
jgi:hypothetical protein